MDELFECQSVYYTQGHIGTWNPLKTVIDQSLFGAVGELKVRCSLLEMFKYGNPLCGILHFMGQSIDQDRKKFKSVVLNLQPNVVRKSIHLDRKSVV